MLHICLYEIRLPPWTYRTLQPWEHLLSMEFVDVAPFCSPVTLSKTCFSLKLQLFPKNVQWEPGFTPKTRGRRRPTAGGGGLGAVYPEGQPMSSPHGAGWRAPPCPHHLPSATCRAPRLPAGLSQHLPRLPPPPGRGQRLPQAAGAGRGASSAGSLSGQGGGAGRRDGAPQDGTPQDGTTRHDTIRHDTTRHGTIRAVPRGQVSSAGHRQSGGCGGGGRAAPRGDGLGTSGEFLSLIHI